MTTTRPDVVNVYEAKTQLSKLLERVAAGDEIIIGKSGKPVARLIPYQARTQRRQFGRLAGSIQLAEDFDQTPEWLMTAFEDADQADPDLPSQ